jgi:hypothetical protein
VRAAALAMHRNGSAADPATKLRRERVGGMAALLGRA